MSTLSEHDELASIYSDMYKDRYNHRPRHIDWAALTVEELRRMVDDLDKVPFAED